jgi:hypothetical protein
MSVVTLSIVNGDSNTIGGQELRCSNEQRRVGDRIPAFPALGRESGPIFSVPFAMWRQQSQWANRTAANMWVVGRCVPIDQMVETIVFVHSYCPKGYFRQLSTKEACQTQWNDLSAECLIGHRVSKAQKHVRTEPRFEWGSNAINTNNWQLAMHAWQNTSQMQALALLSNHSVEMQIRQFIAISSVIQM